MEFPEDAAAIVGSGGGAACSLLRPGSKASELGESW